MTTMGLFIIVLGWLYQLITILKGKKDIQPTFVGLYSLGVLFLIIGSGEVGVSRFISPDGLSLVLSLIILCLLLKNKKKN
jgi:hypothetical protein